MVHSNMLPSSTSRDRAIHPQANRVAGYTLAIGFNALLMMLLLVPIGAAPDWIRTTDDGPSITWYPPEPVPVRPPPLPVPVVQPQPRLHPVDRAVAIPPPTAAADPAPALVAGGTEAAPAATPPVDAAGDFGPPAGPVAGVRLEYLHAPPPDYPRAAVRARAEGTVLLVVRVGVDGRPLEVGVRESSGNRRLDAAARDQVLQRWRFRPAMRDGRPVQAIGLVPVSFRLD